MAVFIDEHRGSYGVEPICAVLPIAPSIYYAHKAMQADPTLRSVRAQRDELLKPEIRRVWMQNFQVYRAKKVWKQLNREGITVARCTVARLMKDLELCGVTAKAALQGDHAHARRRRAPAGPREPRLQRGTP